VYWLINKMKYKYPPGPWSPPLIGHLMSKSEISVLSCNFNRTTVTALKKIDKE